MYVNCESTIQKVTKLPNYFRSYLIFSWKEINVTFPHYIMTKPFKIFLRWIFHTFFNFTKWRLLNYFFCFFLGQQNFQKICQAPRYLIQGFLKAKIKRRLTSNTGFVFCYVQHVSFQGYLRDYSHNTPYCLFFLPPNFGYVSVPLSFLACQCWESETNLNLFAGSPCWAHTVINLSQF